MTHEENIRRAKEVLASLRDRLFFALREKDDDTVADLRKRIRATEMVIKTGVSVKNAKAYCGVE